MTMELTLRDKQVFDNEPYCPCCGKEMSPLYYNDMKCGSLSYMPIYCRKCKEIYIKNGIYFGVSKYYGNEFIIKEEI